MIPDNLLINLKILSKIQKNGRIARSCDGIIALENDTYYQPIKRFISHDSRKQAVFEINSIITECINTLHHILNSKYTNKTFYKTDEFMKNIENLNLLITEMELAKGGILNLKFTYQNDPNISSQLDITILKINTTVRDISQKIHYLQSFNQNNNLVSNNNSSNQSSSHHFSSADASKLTELESIHVDINMNDMTGSDSII